MPLYNTSIYTIKRLRFVGLEYTTGELVDVISLKRETTILIFHRCFLCHLRTDSNNNWISYTDLYVWYAFLDLGISKNSTRNSHNSPILDLV